VEGCWEKEKKKEKANGKRRASFIFRENNGGFVHVFSPETTAAKFGGISRSTL